MKYRWECPECGIVRRHRKKGKSRKAFCIAEGQQCEGLYCDCEAETTALHGTTIEDVCYNACCSHCGWLGTLPDVDDAVFPSDDQEAEESKSDSCQSDEISDLVRAYIQAGERLSEITKDPSLRAMLGQGNLAASAILGRHILRR